MAYTTGTLCAIPVDIIGGILYNNEKELMNEIQQIYIRQLPTNK
jgi:hypothetical protein